jgi:hypothetical protein
MDEHEYIEREKKIIDSLADSLGISKNAPRNWDTLQDRIVNRNFWWRQNLEDMTNYEERKKRSAEYIRELQGRIRRLEEEKMLLHEKIEKTGG